jgi:predicted DNA-binding transcriptional regulator AlpA
VELSLEEVRPDTMLTMAQWCRMLGLRVEGLMAEAALAAVAVGGDQDKVLSVKEWAKLADISERTAYELIERGDSPPVVQLGERRIGIRVCDHRAWLTARTRRKAAA